jgi:hypothetical protein
LRGPQFFFLKRKKTDRRGTPESLSCRRCRHGRGGRQTMALPLFVTCGSAAAIDLGDGRGGGLRVSKRSSSPEFVVALTSSLAAGETTQVLDVFFTGDCNYFAIGVAVRGLCFLYAVVSFCCWALVSAPLQSCATRLTYVGGYKIYTCEAGCGHPAGCIAAAPGKRISLVSVEQGLSLRRQCFRR